MHFSNEIVLVDPAVIYTDKNWKEFIHNPDQFPLILGFTKIITTQLQITTGKFELEIFMPFYNEFFKSKIPSKSGMMSVFIKEELDAFCLKQRIHSSFNYPLGSFFGEIIAPKVLFNEPCILGTGTQDFKLRRF